MIASLHPGHKKNAAECEIKKAGPYAMPSTAGVSMFELGYSAGIAASAKSLRGCLPYQDCLFMPWSITELVHVRLRTQSATFNGLQLRAYVM